MNAMTDGCSTRTQDVKGLSPLTVRLMLWLLLAVIAVVSIWWIDRRAIQRMHEMERITAAAADGPLP